MTDPNKSHEGGGDLGFPPLEITAENSQEPVPLNGPAKGG